ncbi:MAG: hypothetical protein HW416_3578, partial [Chloroflexi bacterium]|nr:hypothetical protein [Chloroflexota bacterium]
GIFASGGLVARINMSWIRNRAEIELGRTTHYAYAETIIADSFVLESDGLMVARAEPNMSGITIRYGNLNYALEGLGFLGMGFHDQLRDERRRLGFVKRAGFFTRRAIAELPIEAPVPLRLFIIWLALFKNLRKAV